MKEKIFGTLIAKYEVDDQEAKDIIDVIADINFFGSEKQIAWSKDIAAEYLAVCFCKLKKMETRGTLAKRTGFGSFEKAYAEACAVVRNLQSAKWWIDHRDGISITRIASGQESIDDYTPEDAAEDQVAREANKHFPKYIKTRIPHAS